ncbi:MAG TPA: alpha-1,4-glucan--maltose-1-phosphate maltosyltransferase [Acidimicrobiales bacterium]|nr:alpha-1,4-glucan--maltose-1-phosphate maltosyltransferase [Acidimicrobiales bacterium]
MVGRIVIDDIRPSTPNRYPAKAVVGETVRVSADIFKDGHDVLAGHVRWRPAANDKWSVAALRGVGNDRWEAVIEPTTLGRHDVVVEAWTDRYASWRHRILTKCDAGQDIEAELLDGAAMIESRLSMVAEEDRPKLEKVVQSLRDDSREQPARMGPAMEPAIGQLLAGPEGARDRTESGTVPLWVDRERAMVGAWYELFPRSYGGLAGTIERLPAIAEMGFDVLYLPPIHPIGKRYRKGPNNSIVAGEDAVGSPWAIGSDEGGHTAIHPDLGTLTDFEALVEKAHELGMEVALDYALQCSPDHPWVKEHPEWFHRRADGSIAYAENPPKKYEDIYPVNFWPEREEDRKALWNEAKGILDFWIAHGVRIFRVDNPHTKPMALWEWMIPAVQSRHPDVVFLAEAFTRPKVMAKLAEIGFSQSYTYFTWRTSRWELESYVDELAHGRTADYMRPTFWPNTPDILSGPLRNGPPAAFKQRLVLAATLVPSYGIYSGYELYENVPASDENEEYLDSEKYEIKNRDWDDPASLAPFIGQMNDIRKRHPALQRLRNVRFHDTGTHHMIAYSKQTDDRSDVVLVVVNLDPWSTHECVLNLDLGALGLPWDRPFEAYDELTGEAFGWQGPHPYVRLDAGQAAHVLHLRPVTGGSA